MSRTDNQRMADAHEEHIVDLIGGRIPRGSGNQWRDKLDGKHDASDPFAFAWDAKSTRKGSYSVSKKLWAKITEEADGLRPALPIRFYEDSPKLKAELDLVVLTLDDFAEMLEALRDAQMVSEDSEQTDPGDVPRKTHEESRGYLRGGDADA